MALQSCFKLAPDCFKVAGPPQAAFGPPQDAQDDSRKAPKMIQIDTRDLQKPLKNTVFLKFFSKIQPIPFVLCSMLIKNGLKISSRSLQERSRMPQDAQQLPTWGQHGRQDRSKGSKNLVPRDPKWTPNRPQMGTKQTPNGLQTASS